MNPELTALLRRGDSVPLRRNLTDLTGCPDKALVLGQMVYWAERTKKPGGWFWKSAQELAADLMGIRSRRTIADLLDALVAEDWLLRRHGDAPLKRAYWYRLNEEKLTVALREWSTSHAETAIGNGCQSNGDSRQSSGTGCQYSREHTAESTGSETAPSPIGVGGGGDSAAGTLSSEDMARATHAVDLALRRAYGVIADQLWPLLDANIRQGRALDEVFGPTFSIRWTPTERGYLQEIVALCGKQWPALDPISTAAALIRSSLLIEAKAFQLLKFWIQHARSQPTLRPYLTLAGGGRDPTARLALLQELAAIPRVQKLIQTTAVSLPGRELPT